MESRYPGLLERFLKYAKQNTRSDAESAMIPSTPRQTTFLKELQAELTSIGITDAKINPENSYLTGTIPSNLDKEVPVMGLIAHIDTDDFNAENIQPQVIENYDGVSDIHLGDSPYVLSPQEFPALKNYAGETLVTTDGTTLLGADDKAGVSAIVTFAEYLFQHPGIKHGKIRLGFGPDEEIGTGADHFDVDDFGADFAYTVDGGPLGELEYETFNAAQATINFTGKNVHTGVAKDTMINALQLAIDFHNQLPTHDRAELTADREGFFHLYQLGGTVDAAQATYLIRDHDRQLFEFRKTALEAIARDMNARFDQDRVQVKISDQYYNLKDALNGHLESVEMAKQAMEALSIKPIIYPVRGGTDGSKISYMGLPTPNLFAGGENMHSRFEFVSVQTMEQVVNVLLKISDLNIADN